jgi:hypothetical protein
VPSGPQERHQSCLPEVVTMYWSLFAARYAKHNNAEPQISSKFDSRWLQLTVTTTAASPTPSAYHHVLRHEQGHTAQVTHTGHLQHIMPHQRGNHDTAPHQLISTTQQPYYPSVGEQPYCTSTVLSISHAKFNVITLSCGSRESSGLTEC